MTLSKALRDRFKRLGKRLSDGQVLPFVGAGISMGARIERDPDFEPTLAYMKACLVKKLRSELKKLVQSDPSSDRCDSLSLILSLICPEKQTCTQLQKLLQPAVECLQNEDGEQKALSILRSITLKGESPCYKIEEPKNSESTLLAAVERCCPSDCLSFDRLVEIAAWLWGHETVCEIIQIEKFTDLEPLPAHRYLAYLAREGLITEIITTNYDCCIERAFCRSFGSWGSLQAKEALAVIHNLNEYRLWGGYRFTENHPYRPILHLYKINGCADEYRNYRQSAECIHITGPYFKSEVSARIVLTEKQLQTFREENWARDLFQDRARTRALLFCGFGSEEPQVRHTALRIMEEFQNIPCFGKRRTPGEIALLPNAPFVAAYEQPTFTQVQILGAFMWAHLSDDYYREGLAGLSAACLNAFCGVDAKALDGKDELTADLFLRYLYLLGFRCLLERETMDGSPFCKWLEYHGVPAKRWCGWLRHTLYPPEIEDTEPDRIFGTLREFFVLDKDYPRGPMTFWRWLAAMEKPILPNYDHDWYLPIREDSLLVLITLLLLVGLTEIKNADSYPTPVQGLGLRIRIKEHPSSSTVKRTNGNQPNSSIYLVSEASGAKVDLQSLDDHTRLIRRLAVPSLRHLDRERRWMKVFPSDDKKIKRVLVGRILTVAAADLIRVAGNPEQMDQVLPVVFAEDKPQPHIRLNKVQPGKEMKP